MIFILLLLIITAQNIAPVDLNFFTYQFQLPLIVLLGFVFFLGFFSAIIFVRPPKKEEKVLNKKVEKELDKNIVEDLMDKEA